MSSLKNVHSSAKTFSSTSAEQKEDFVAKESCVHLPLPLWDCKRIKDRTLLSSEEFKQYAEAQKAEIRSRRHQKKKAEEKAAKKQIGRKIAENRPQTELSTTTTSSISTHQQQQLDAVFSDLSISDGSSPVSKWTLWRYDSRDLPVHIRCFSTPCYYCTEVNKLRAFCKNKTEESTERYAGYLKPEVDFEDGQQMLKNVDIKGDGPNKLVKDVFFNHKLGVAFFRDNIPPMYESEENKDGGAFQMLLLATTGSSSRHLFLKFDELFKRVLRRVVELQSPLAQLVNGLFCRCEINPGKYIRNDGQNHYGNPVDLPCMIKLEIWIADEKRQNELWPLIISINQEVKRGFPEKAFREFTFINRYYHNPIFKQK